MGKGPGITNIGTNTLKLNQEAMDIIAEMQKAGYKLENIDEASIKIFLNNRNQPAPTGKQTTSIPEFKIFFTSQFNLRSSLGVVRLY